jgi:hydrogenase maturation protease
VEQLSVILRTVRILIAGVGNLLRGDDGFGVAVAHRLLSTPLPEELRVMDVGIGGIHMVQELLEPADALIVIDAVDLGRAPGTVFVIRPDVADVASMPLDERHDHLADMHYATPERALMLARGMGMLPETTWIVGCQPSDVNHLGEGLTAPVEAAIEPVIREVKRLVTDAGVEW